MLCCTVSAVVFAVPVSPQRSPLSLATQTLLPYSAVPKTRSDVEIVQKSTLYRSAAWTSRSDDSTFPHILVDCLAVPLAKSVPEFSKTVAAAIWTPRA